MYDWTAETWSGVAIPGMGRGQSALKDQKVRSLTIKGPGLGIPFSFPIPRGAEVRIFKRHAVSVSSSQTRYWFGWEHRDGSQRYFEFGGPQIRAHFNR